MKKCKDCYHYKICENNLIQQGMDPTSVVLASTIDDSVGDCPYFQDKAMLIELPCKVGDTVYTNESMQGWYMRRKDRPYEAKIVFIGINGKDNFMNVVLKNDNMLQFPFSEIRKTVFLTRDEANKDIRRVEND